jgi:catechol 2,3-dioxygenase-like lactoylglutathione lyase family enzyme
MSIPVHDQDRSRTFYCDTLELELVADDHIGPDRRWVQVRPPGAATSLALVTWFPSMAPGSMKGIVLETDDLDRDVERLTRRGVDLLSPVETALWGRFVTFDDPDGNGVVLQATSAPSPGVGS